MAVSSIACLIPSEVDDVRLIKHSSSSETNLQGDTVVEFLASPVNKVDFMVLAGTYPVKPTASIGGRSIPGFDGCARVIRSDSEHLQPGDLVIPSRLGLGTWRTHAVLPHDALIKIPRETPPVAAALLRSGVVIAWLLLHEILTLKKGDWIIMTAGTSSVAQFLVQLARIQGIKVVLVVRENSEIGKTKAKLKELGAEMILTESELLLLPSFPGPIMLALDCVFGRLGEALLEVVAPAAKYVLVGVLNGLEAAVTLKAKHLFTKQITLTTFRGSVILSKTGDDDVARLFNDLAHLFVQQSLVLPDLDLQAWPAEEEVMRAVLRESGAGTSGTKKTVWVFQEAAK
ncbi:Zinc-binding dehydrogenase-like protein 4 [Elsinoe fawcettii]|nr:Zinc-binding dehydrogenase-like protein 4 [Elsinoe fawcettii]